MKSDHSDDRIKRVLLRFLTLPLAIAFAFFLSGQIRPARSASAHTNDGNVSLALGVLFTVTSTADTPDAVVGNGLCADSSGRCTLRAAIQEANANSTDDAIEFNIPKSDPGWDGGRWIINLNSALPNLSTNLTISGPGPFRSALIVQRNSSNQFRILTVTSAANVSISTMTILGGSVAGNGGG